MSTKTKLKPGHPDWLTDPKVNRIALIKAARALMFHLKKLGIRVESDSYGLNETKHFVLRRFPFEN